MIHQCSPEAIVVPSDQPIEAIVVPSDQPVEIVTEILRGPTGPTGPPAPGGGEVRGFFSPTTGQTVFGLGNTVILPDLSKLVLNGLKLSYPGDYGFDGAMTSLLFLVTDYDLEPDDELELYYYI